MVKNMSEIIKIEAMDLQKTNWGAETKMSLI
ncbi:hypothetical protein LCGC14_2282730, partial [marine sediment metagenome]